MLKKYFLMIVCLSLALPSSADSISKYAKVAKSIPEMSLKASPQAQAWMRSAKSILAITDETVAQTIVAMNNEAKKQGHPIICPKENVEINGTVIHELLLNVIKGGVGDNDSESISSIAIRVLMTAYPCEKSGPNRLAQAWPGLGFRKNVRMKSERL